MPQDNASTNAPTINKASKLPANIQAMSDAETTEALKAQLAKLQAQNDSLKVQVAKAHTMSIKVSDKGAVSVYGLGRFPVTLYQGQWRKLLAKADAIGEFIDANQGKLASKD